MEMKFEVDGQKHILRGMSDGGLRTVSIRRMERILRHDHVQWAAEILVMPEIPK